MDYQKFVKELTTLYQNWGQDSVSPSNPQFEEALKGITGKISPNIMQLLNWAVKCLEEDEIYCEIGSYHGATLIGALLDNPDVVAYSVDNGGNLSEFAVYGETLAELTDNLAKFSLEEQVLLCNQDLEEFFFDLKQYEPDTKIGVYFYNGSPDYRSQLLGLLLTRLFLTDQALIIVNNTNWQTVKQANLDFLASERKCRLLLDFQTPSKNHHTFGNGIQVFSWDVNENVDYDWTEFAEKFRSEEVIKGICKLHFQVDIQKEEIAEKIYKEALCLELSEAYEESAVKYQEVLNYWADNHHIYHELGLVFFQIGNINKSEEYVKKAIAIDSSVSNYHYSLGLIAQKQGENQKAIECYQRAIELNPQLVDAYKNLGNIFQTSGNLDNAYLIYNNGIINNPEHFVCYLCLGNLLREQQKLDEALKFYQQAWSLFPQNPDVLYNLGLIAQAKNNNDLAVLHFGFSAYYQAKYEKAISHFREFLATNKGDSYCFDSLAKCYQKLNKPEDAINVYQEAIKNNPQAFELYVALISTLQSFGDQQKAIDYSKEASQLFPDNIILQLTDLQILPIIYKDQAEIDFYRERFTKKLKHITEQIILDSLDKKKQALIAIGYQTNFFLQYQGKNDLLLQEKYGNFVYQVMSANYPQWTQPLKQRSFSQGDRVKIGYICSNLLTVRKLFGGWVKNHDKKKVEVYSYFFSEILQQKSQEFAIYSDMYRHIPNNLEAMCEQILADKLDILVFLDIGMTPITTQMAGLRLAPIQCLTWGHPITSGIPTVDYFLSSEFMEVEKGQEHYTEKLILLPKISICYPQPKLPQKREDRSFFNLKSEAIIYLSCQSTFKYLPQYDYIFPSITLQVPHAQFAFITSVHSENNTKVFKTRLENAFAQYDLNFQEYCFFLSRLNQEEYLNVNLVSDIYLDTLSWSGGNTTLEAIACNLPVVTCPGEFMRGRHSYAILKMLGVTETIASNETEYIDIAVRLGNDAQWRQNIVEKIKANHSNLYDDQECVRGLEDFYQDVVLSK